MKFNRYTIWVRDATAKEGWEVIVYAAHRSDAKERAMRISQLTNNDGDASIVRIEQMLSFKRSWMGIDFGYENQGRTEELSGKIDPKADHP